MSIRPHKSAGEAAPPARDVEPAPAVAEGEAKPKLNLASLRTPLPPYNGPSGLNRVAETVKLVLGCLFMMVLGPYLAFQIGITKLWDFIDGSVLERGGVGLVQTITKISSRLEHLTAHWTAHPEIDGFVVHLYLWLAYFYPVYFFYELYLCSTYGFSAQRLIVYNIIRIGPMYRGFMYTYVWCHKEAHNYGQVFNSKVDSPLKTLLIDGPFGVARLLGLNPLGKSYMFNLWCGLFHGVLPGTFTHSHIYNHHKYSNSSKDVYCTAYRPRNEFANFLRYLPEWFLYATNVSSILAFWSEGRTCFAVVSIFATLYYVIFVAVCWRIHALFTLCTLIYALLEANILLSIVNFVWHGFVDDRDPPNEYVNSTTVIEGLNFTAFEEYHVVHHQYAGVHWTKHPEMYEKHGNSYFGASGTEAEAPAEVDEGQVPQPSSDHDSRSTAGSSNDLEETLMPTSFYRENVFVIFGAMMAKDYKLLAKLYYKPHARGASEEEIAAVLERRLVAHGRELADAIGGGDHLKKGD